MIKILEIQIKRFRSINDLTLPISEDYNISTICGQNNVGKTNVLRAIRLFFDKSNFDFKKDVPEFKQMTLGATVYPLILLKFKDKKGDIYEIEKNYDIRRINESSPKDYTLNGKKNNEELKEDEIKRFLESINLFFLPSINVSFPETINYLIDEKFLDIEFGNAKMKGKKGAVKEALEKARNTLQEILDDLTNSIDPTFKEFNEAWGIKFIVPTNINRFREIINQEIDFVLTDDTKSEIQSKGSGLQRLGHILLNLRIIEKLVLSKKNCILLIDEPDIYLHSKLQKKLNEKLKIIAKDTQVFLTTHSPIFINGYKMKNLFLLELQVQKQFSTRKKDFGNVLQTQLADLKKADIIYLIKETLGIEDKDNLTFGQRNLIVEGEEDKKYISELAKIFELPLCNIISTGGVTNFPKYLDYYNSISENEEAKHKFTLLYDNDEEGRKMYNTLAQKKYDKIITKHIMVIDSQNTTFPEKKGINVNIEIEDLIYPEIILELANSIFSVKKGFKKVSEKVFLRKMTNPSIKYNGVLDVIDDIKNENNPDLGYTLSTKDMSFKGGMANKFTVEGNTNMIDKILELDNKYPEVKKFLNNLLTA